MKHYLTLSEFRFVEDGWSPGLPVVDPTPLVWPVGGFQLVPAGVAARVLSGHYKGVRYPGRLTKRIDRELRGGLGMMRVVPLNENETKLVQERLHAILQEVEAAGSKVATFQQIVGTQALFDRHAAVRSLIKRTTLGPRMAIFYIRSTK